MNEYPRESTTGVYTRLPERESPRSLMMARPPPHVRSDLVGFVENPEGRRSLNQTSLIVSPQTDAPPATKMPLSVGA
jgi:hypothetical protein